MTPDRAELIAWAKEQEAQWRELLTQADDDVETAWIIESADRFAAIVALLEARVPA